MQVLKVGVQAVEKSRRGSGKGDGNGTRSFHFKLLLLLYKC